MALQIKEVHIKVTVNADEGQPGAQEAAGTAIPEGGSGTMDKSMIIAECVDQVMQILKEKMEP